MAILYCENCDKIPKIYFNGYRIGDRTLEDVPVGVLLAPSAADKKVQDLTPDDVVIEWQENDSYLQTLNLNYWGERARQYACEPDSFQCATCKGQDLASLYDDEEHAEKALAPYRLNE